MGSQRATQTWTYAWYSLMAAQALRHLRVGCSFVPQTEPGNWFTIVDDPRRTTVVAFELAMGLERERTQYNLAGVEIVRKHRTIHVGQHSGFSDVFVPVARGKTLYGVLVSGPILTREPTAPWLKSLWQELSGATTDPDDEAFLRFARSTLDSHVFEGEALDVVIGQVQDIANAMSGGARIRHRVLDGSDQWLASRRRAPEASMWTMASEMVDREANAAWMASYRATDRALEGLPRLPNHVIAVAAHGSDEDDLEPVDLLIRTHRLQRACAAFANEFPNTVAGRIGSQAAFFLTYIDPAPQARSRLIAFAERLRRMARRRLGTDVYFGFSAAARLGGELPRRYDESFWAVLLGLHNAQRHTFYGERGARHSAESPGLYRSARVLYEHFAVGRPRETDLCAEQVVKEVLWLSSGSLEVVRSHLLQILWELLTLTERRAAIDKRTVSDLLANVTSRLRESRTTQALAGLFVELTRELAETVARPGAADRRSKLERARRLVEQSDRAARLDLATVAAKIGMSRSNFTRSFRATYRTSFGEFVVRTRVERSKRLLRSTTLGMSQISAEAGWSSPSYFFQAFKRTTGTTPGQYQRRARGGVRS
jgi:AraC-like DNA-binding protein